MSHNQDKDGPLSCNTVVNVQNKSHFIVQHQLGKNQDTNVNMRLSVQHQADKYGMHYKPAKCKPALLQAIAVIIMCEPSSECTKFGGNADLCRLLSTWRSNMTIHQNEGKPKPIPCELNLEVKLPYHSPAARPEAEVLFLSASSSEKI